MTYAFHTEEKDRIGLHDCRSNEMRYENGIFTIRFPDGFYDLDRPEPDRTGCAELQCRIIDRDLGGIEIFIFRETEHGTIREDWSDTFCDAMRENGFEFECVTTYYAYRRILIKGYVWFNEEPYHRECEIALSADRRIFSWNEAE